MEHPGAVTSGTLTPTDPNAPAAANGMPYNTTWTGTAGFINVSVSGTALELADNYIDVYVVRGGHGVWRPASMYPNEPQIFEGTFDSQPNTSPPNAVAPGNPGDYLLGSAYPGGAITISSNDPITKFGFRIASGDLATFNVVVQLFGSAGNLLETLNASNTPSLGNLSGGGICTGLAAQGTGAPVPCNTAPFIEVVASQPVYSFSFYTTDTSGNADTGGFFIDTLWLNGTLGIVATPTFSVAAGMYTTPQSVSLSTTTPGATIRYTTDGSTPSETTGTVYASPISVNSTATIKAIAYLANWTDSAVATATYTITSAVAPPSISPVSGTYTSAQVVTLSTTTPGATIRYTTGGSTPSETVGTVYSAPFTLFASATVKAIAYEAGWIDSSVTPAGYTITGTVSAPSFGVTAGTYSSAQTVYLSSGTPGATIRYTTDGVTTPTETVGTIYTAPVSVNSTMTIKAIAYEANWLDSAVVSASYTMQAAAPSFSPPAGTYNANLSVAISSSAGATIRYTTDGSTPSDTTGNVYAGPIAVSATNTTIEAIAFESGWTDSPIVSAAYVLAAAAPAFGPAAGTYSSAQTVYLSSGTPGASIRYTTDGSTPSPTTGNLYTGSIEVNTSTTIRAISYENNYATSGVMSATYTIQYPTQTITTSPTTSPSGLSLLVDGNACTSPCAYQWAPGSSHTISGAAGPGPVTAGQTVNGTHYLFSGWSDGGPLSHGITAPPSSSTYTATFSARVPIYGGVSPSQLEVNLGPLPIDVYDGSIANGSTFPTCPSGTVAQACMEGFLSSYAIQGITGVRFQLALQASPSTAFDSVGNVRGTWSSNLAQFFTDLSAFGITKITPTLATGEPWGGVLSGPTCAAYLSGCPAPPTAQCTVQGTGQPGKFLNFFPWLPYGLDPNDGNNPDGRLDQGNNAYYCSPANPMFWGWSKLQALVASIASSAQGAGLTIEEFDLQNEVALDVVPVQARLIYDNITMTPVFQLLGQALADHGSTAGVLTVSVNTDSPGDLTPGPLYPCKSLYGDAAQVLPSSELLAATGGAVIGSPLYVAANGAMACDNSVNSGCPSPTTDPQGWATCATSTMFYIPLQGSPATQPTPTVTDMHAKPCVAPGAVCNLSNDATSVARDTFSAVWDFLSYRNLIGNTIMFGETWSSTPFYYPGKICDGPFATNMLAQQSVAGYLNSTLYSSGGPLGMPGAYAGNVVFRPWENTLVDGQTCQTPANIGAPNGPYKQ